MLSVPAPSPAAPTRLSPVVSCAPRRGVHAWDHRHGPPQRLLEERRALCPMQWRTTLHPGEGMT